jgi:hypothetical protein
MTRGDIATGDELQNCRTAKLQNCKTAKLQNCKTKKLHIHHLRLVVNRFFMNCPENLDDKFFAQAFLRCLVDAVPEQFIPPARLQDGNVILLFVFADLPGNRHPVIKDLDDLVVIFVNFMAQVFQR